VLAPRQVDRGLAMDVADLLIGQLEKFVGRALEGRGRERLECVPQLVLL
jgi:hypothetical protein